MKILKYLVLLTVSISHFSLFSQNIDSILSNLSSITKDTEVLDSLVSIIGQTKAAQPELAISLCHRALALAKSTNNSRVSGQVYYDMAFSFYYQYEIDSMIHYATLALQAAHEQSDKKLSYTSNNLLGIGTKSQQKYGTALEYFKTSIQEAEANQDTLTAGPALVNLAQIYNFMGDSTETINSYERAIEIFKKYQDSLNLAVTYQNLGIFLTDIDSSIAVLSSGLTVFEALDHKIGQGYTLNSIASRMIEKGDYLNGMRYLNLAKDLMEEIDFKELLPSIYLNLANANAKYGLFSKAEEYWSKSEMLSKENDDLLFLRDFYESKSNQEEEMGLYKASLLSFQQYDAVKDSLDQIERQEELEDLRAKYEDEKRQAEITLLNKDVEIKDITIKRTTIIASILGIGSVLFLALFGLVYRFYRSARKAQTRSDELLLNILPFEVAEELKAHGRTAAKKYDSIAVLFTDFEGFSTIAHELNPNEVVEAVDYYFREFDKIVERCGIEKIKTIGDAYFAVSGLNNDPDYVDNMVDAALAIQKFVQSTKRGEKDVTIASPFDVRIGIHVGPVVAGVVGIKKFQYDIWGDTVNIASRMESNCTAGKVMISEATYLAIRDRKRFTFKDRGQVEIKNLGLHNCYFVSQK